VVLVAEDLPNGRLPELLFACTPERHVATSDALTAEPGTVFVQAELLGRVATLVPAGTRLIAIGDVGELAEAGVAMPDCVLFGDADEATLRAVLAGGTRVDEARLLDELLCESLFGADLGVALQELTMRLARAFDADDCILLLSDDASCFTASQISEEVVTELAPLCERVCQLGTTLIAPARREHPYRSFLGVPLVHDSAASLALLLLCRRRPLPFGRDARYRLRQVARRIATDLAWRLVQERLLADRDKLRDVSRIDPVLGVANRTALQEELTKQVAASEHAGEPFSVAVIDVDGLRLVNERSGFPAGDAVLTHIAQVARSTIRSQDLVARYAGDSVAIALPGLAAPDALHMLTKILSAIDEQPVVHEDKPIHLTVSAGIAEVRYDQDTGETALARAAAARQNARLHGDVIAVADGETIVDAPAQPAFAIGTTLGGVYQIRHEISRGAFGVVYRAEDLALGRQVALKLLRPDLARDTGFVERFRTEAATLARIRNPNLVQVYAFGIDGSNVYFAMELIEGQGLDERINSARRRRHHLPLPEVVGVIDQVANALEAVHSAGVLHRDVKPENVLVDRIHRRCVLVDVGIAVRRGSEKNPAGTPGFTAPEVFGAVGESPATDVYSLGALAYLLLTLQTPFGDATPYELISLQATQRPLAPTAIRGDLPAEVDRVLLPALDPDPAERPQSARALAKALSEALSQSPTADKRRRTRMVIEPVEPPRRLMTFRNASTPSSSSSPSPSLRTAPAAVPSTRAVLFRSAYEVLGARRGNSWIADMSRKLPELGLALSPKGSSLAWYSTSAFIAMLESLADEGAGQLALQLGRTAIASSFGQFYGADPAALTPAEVLRSVDMFWHCYHSWGAASVSAHGCDAEVLVAQGVASPILCSSTAGLLHGVVAHAGGQNVVVEHRACIAERARECVFHLSWR